MSHIVKIGGGALVCSDWIVAASQAGTAQTAGRKYIYPKDQSYKSLPFSEAVLAGDTLYVAGHIGTEAEERPGTGESRSGDEVAIRRDPRGHGRGELQDGRSGQRASLHDGPGAVRQVQRRVSRAVCQRHAVPGVHRRGFAAARRALRNGRGRGQEPIARSQ